MLPTDFRPGQRVALAHGPERTGAVVRTTSSGVVVLLDRSCRKVRCNPDNLTVLN